MNKYVLIVLFIISFLQAAYPQSGNWEQFIPPGFSLMDSASADLNKDGKRDMLLILKNDQEANSTDTTRPLLVLLGGKNNSFELYARNDSVVLCKGCGGVFGDPYEGITVKNNFFSIEHYGGSSWRWTRVITFRYDAKSKKIWLHRDAGESFHTSEPAKTTTTVHRKADFGKLPFERYSYHKVWNN